MGNLQSSKKNKKKIWRSGSHHRRAYPTSC